MFLPAAVQKRHHCSHQILIKHQTHAASSPKFVSQQRCLNKHYHVPVINKISQRGELKLIYSCVKESEKKIKDRSGLENGVMIIVCIKYTYKFAIIIQEANSFSDLI